MMSTRALNQAIACCLLMASTFTPAHALTQQELVAKLEAAGFRVAAWQDTTEPALQSATARARNAVSPPPALGTHLILGGDWQAMFHNSARNLEERRTELFNAVLQRVG